MNEDIEQARVIIHGQLRLFPARPHEVCNKIGLNWIAALKLLKDGFLSFNPSDKESLDEAQEAELLFLGTLVVAGCDGVMLKQMLKTLKKPYQYRIEQIYYDWEFQNWRLFPHLDKNIREQIIRESQFMTINEDYLEDLFKKEVGK